MLGWFGALIIAKPVSNSPLSNNDPVKRDDYAPARVPYVFPPLGTNPVSGFEFPS
jgi:hypothetical protein